MTRKKNQMAQTTTFQSMIKTLQTGQKSKMKNLRCSRRTTLVSSATIWLRNLRSTSQLLKLLPSQQTLTSNLFSKNWRKMWVLTKTKSKVTILEVKKLKIGPLASLCPENPPLTTKRGSISSTLEWELWLSKNTCTSYSADRPNSSQRVSNLFSAGCKFAEMAQNWNWEKCLKHLGTLWGSYCRRLCCKPSSLRVQMVSRCNQCQAQSKRRVTRKQSTMSVKS